jgi:hypothetical protein
MILKLAKSERVNPHRCLKCGENNDVATGVVNKQARNTLKPKPGDVMLCFTCAHVMMFADDLSFRELTPEELKHAAADPRLQTAKAAIFNMRTKQ